MAWFRTLQGSGAHVLWRGRKLDWSCGEDIDSSLIPQMYFDYLRGGPAEPLVGIFRHNQMDLRGLAALAAGSGLPDSGNGIAKTLRTPTRAIPSASNTLHHAQSRLTARVRASSMKPQRHWPAAPPVERLVSANWRSSPSANSIKTRAPFPCGTRCENLPLRQSAANHPCSHKTPSGAGIRHRSRRANSRRITSTAPSSRAARSI